MTMEDVWKDISLASLCDHSSSPASASALNSAAAASTKDPAALRGFIFQDFMSAASAASTKRNPNSCLALDLAAPPPPPPTLLSLSSSGSDHHFSQHQLQSTATTKAKDKAAAATAAPVKKPRLPAKSTTMPSSSLISFSYEALDSSPYSKKRLGALEVEENGERSRHVRHRRMMKNRESASRSRARKQAYTNELELELAHLQEENARLKRQQEKLCLATPAAPVTTTKVPKRAHSV